MEMGSHGWETADTQIQVDAGNLPLLVGQAPVECTAERNIPRVVVEAAFYCR